MHYRTVSYWILTNFLQGILSLGALGIQTSDRMFHGPEIDVSRMVVVDYAESFVFADGFGHRRTDSKLLVDSLDPVAEPVVE